MDISPNKHLGHPVNLKYLQFTTRIYFSAYFGNNYNCFTRISKVVVVELFLLLQVVVEVVIVVLVSCAKE